MIRSNLKKIFSRNCYVATPAQIRDIFEYAGGLPLGRARNAQANPNLAMAYNSVCAKPPLSHVMRSRVVTNNVQGALLISLILALTLVAVLGAAMVYLTSSNQLNTLAAARYEQAYYLAYSGLSFWDAQPTKPSLPKTYTLANGDRFVLDTEGVPEKLTSTGIVTGPFGEVQVKITSRGQAGSPAWIDTMEDTGNWGPTGPRLGEWGTSEIAGNRALRTAGQNLPLTGAGTPTSLQTAINDAATARDSYENQRNASSPYSLEWFTFDFLFRSYEALVAALEDAQAILIAAGVPDDAVTLPVEFDQPKVFAAFDWRNAGGGIPLYDYWTNLTYDGVGHEQFSLSYDLQLKLAVIPEADDYLAGISLRVDQSVGNGGNLLGLSIVRGHHGGRIPDNLIPLDDSATPIIVLWAQKDRNGDGLITSEWQYTVPPSGPTLTLWPEEREILAWAPLPLSYCMLQADPRHFKPWLSLLVRLEERNVSASEASSGFAAGDRINTLQVFLATTDLCHGGGSISGPPPNFFLDNRRGASLRLAPLSPFINWPVFDFNNFRITTDNFSLVGGGFTQIRWFFVSPSPSAVHGFRVALRGSSTAGNANAVIWTDAFTTAAYSTDIDDWPEELGLHAMGFLPTDAAAVYFDDFAVRLRGRDPGIR